jgi:hypothetical protein
LRPTVAVAGCAAGTSAATHGAATNAMLSAGVVRAAIKTTVTATAASTTRPITSKIHGTVTGEPSSASTHDHALRVRQAPVQTAHAESGIQASVTSIEILKPQR